MKLIINNKCIVEKEDLEIDNIPSDFVIDKEENGLLYISDEYSVSYIKNSSDILDYLDVCNLSMIELNALYDNYVDRKNTYAKDILTYRYRVRRNERYLSAYHKYDTLSISLKKYIDNKEAIDDKLQGFISSYQRIMKQAQ